MRLLDFIIPKKEHMEGMEHRSDLLDKITGGSTSVTSNYTNTKIDEDSIQKIPAVVSCLELISGTISQLPIYLYKDVEGSTERIKDDERLFLLNNEPNDYMSAYNLKKSMVKDYLLHGKSYTYVEKKGNIVKALYPLNARDMKVEKYIDKNGYKYNLEYEYSSEGGVKVYKPYNLVTVLRNSKDGKDGEGLLKVGADVFALALNEMEYSSNILNRGSLPLGILETTSKLSKDTLMKLRKSWESLYSGAKNSGKTVILEEGLSYKPLSLSPSDLNLNESKRYSAHEICRLFNVPPSLVIGEQGYGSVEQDNLQFLKYCISKVITNIESELDRTLLLENEKGEGYYFRFDISEMLRTTEKEKFESVKLGIESGILTINEARTRVDLEDLEKDYLMVNLGSVFYDTEEEKFIVPNMGANIDGSQSSSEVDLNGKNDKKSINEDSE